jgi:Zn-finger nucleic acid-binding protein
MPWQPREQRPRQGGVWLDRGQPRFPRMVKLVSTVRQPHVVGDDTQIDQEVVRWILGLPSPSPCIGK